MSNKNKKVQPRVAMRPLTFGDFEGQHLKLRNNEAAIIVLDKKKAAAAMFNADVNPFVVAFAGDPDMIAKEKAKYENDPRYEIEFFPAESN